jgi:hypothetical protein
VIVCGLLPPTPTFPKFTLVGLMDNCACVCVAVPLIAIVNGEFVALLVIVIVPLGLPVVVGAKTALKEACAPAAITCPTDSPLML